MFRHALLAVIIFSVSGCASTSLKNAVPDILKSREQIQVEKTEAALLDIRGSQILKYQNLAKIVPPATKQITGDVAEYRRNFLGIRRGDIVSLLKEFEDREAKLKKDATRAGYFMLGTKSLGIVSGIASAVLVAASPANAATVAGLAALSSGTAAFQDTATEVGYSTVIAQTQLEAMKEATAKAYDELKKVPFDYLDSYAAIATQEQWDAEMRVLGSAIIELEKAVRMTKFEIKISPSST